MAKNLTHTQRVRVLYKTILRLHRGLPPELQELGTQYAKDEFRRHKNCDPAQAVIFMTEWTDYTLTLAQQLGLRGKPRDQIGKPLDQESINLFNDEQIAQLYELLKASKGDVPEVETEVHQVEIIDNHKKK